MNKYEIYQLDLDKDDSVIRDYAFRSYREVMKDGLSVSKDRYVMVYVMESFEEISPEDLYFIFNEMRPDDFTGHSLSVSDVVRTPDGYWYCDSFGWVRLKEWEDAD